MDGAAPGLSPGSGQRLSRSGTIQPITMDTTPMIRVASTAVQRKESISSRSGVKIALVLGIGAAMYTIWDVARDAMRK